jgi:hypothetical protein
VTAAVATAPEALKSDAIRFAHESERQFAKLLDFYQIEWDYEPRSFDIEWDKEGNVTQRFTPDFFLPQFDLYIEITTLNQRLVTKKNRKARRLKELYPEVNIRVFYQRDYHSLLLKYGLEPPSQLAGLAGATPPVWLDEQSAEPAVPPPPAESDQSPGDEPRQRPKSA